MAYIRRRKFITLLGGAAALPLEAPAQRGERMRRIGVLLGSTAPDRPDVAAFLKALLQLCWKVAIATLTTATAAMARRVRGRRCFEHLPERANTPGL
jgi:hypothetical protein